jgi:hypothetical protein
MSRGASARSDESNKAQHNQVTAPELVERLDWSDLVPFGSWRLGDKCHADAILGLLLKDTDRAAAIVAAIMLEDSLERKLKETLRDSTLFDKLFGRGRPLQFFSHRNQLAYMMRVYGKPFYQEMEKIASIRNCFAHMYVDKKSNQPVRDFKSPRIKGLCNQLILMEHLERAEEDRRNKLGLRAGKLPSWARDTQPLETLKSPRIRYVKTCALCISALNGDLARKIIQTIWADDLT